MNGPRRRADVLIIVPAYNEGAALGGVLEELQREVPNYDVVVVNDGSIDDTAAVARSAGYEVVDLSFNLRIGGAVQAGFKYALEHEYPIAVQMDGDGQHPADQVEALVAPVRAGECEMTIGTRFLRESGSDYEVDFWRRVGIRFLSWICTTVTRQTFTDASSGFRAFGPRALRFFAAYYPADSPEPVAIVLLNRRGFPIQEVPVRMRPRQAGESSIGGFSAAYYMIKVSLALLLAVFKSGPANETA